MIICAPALIYVIFSLTQVIIDTFKGLYNTAFFKLIVMILVTTLLNTLCENGLGVASWIIVFVPFIFMTVVVSLLLYIFGMDAATGKLHKVCESDNVETPYDDDALNKKNAIVANANYYRHPYRHGHVYKPILIEPPGNLPLNRPHPIAAQTGVSSLIPNALLRLTPYLNTTSTSSSKTPNYYNTYVGSSSPEYTS